MMKQSNKIIVSLLIIVTILITSISTLFANTSAGSFSVSGSSSFSPNQINTFTITADDCAGTFSITTTGGKLNISSVFIDNSSATFHLTAPASGKFSVTITPTDVTSLNADLTPVKGAKTLNFTVKDNSSDTSSNTSSNSSSNTSSNNNNSSNNNSSSSNNSSTSNTSSSNNSSSNNTSSNSTPVVKLSSNNKLSSLSVDSFELQPAFDSNILDYSLNIVDTKNINIQASCQDSKAKVSGHGAKELSLGYNTFSITVTAENKSTKTYNLKVYYDETPTVFTKYNNKELGVVKNTGEASIPATFEQTTVTLDGNEVPAWTSNVLNKTILYLSDAENNKGFYIYDTETSSVTSPIIPIGLLGQNVFIVDEPQETQIKDGMTYKEVVVDQTTLMGWTFNDPALENYCVIKVMDSNGNMVEFLHEKTLNSIILKPDLAPVTNAQYLALMDKISALETEKNSLIENNENLENKSNILLLVACIIGVLLLVLIALFVFKIRSKKNTFYK